MMYIFAEAIKFGTTEFYKGNSMVYFLGFTPTGKNRGVYAPFIRLAKFPDAYADGFKKLVEALVITSVLDTEGETIMRKITLNLRELFLLRRFYSMTLIVRSRLGQ